MELHILITGVGRRVELIQAFRQAALNLNIMIRLYGADMSGTAPALAFCDFSRKVCRMKDADYIPQLLEICKVDNIDLVIPTIDTDLLVLSENVKSFEKIGTKVLISEPDKIGFCRDKTYTTDFFKACGLKAPETFSDYTIYEGPFPCFIKPKDGSSSINAFKINSKSELHDYAERVENYIIQPFIEGKEYTIDIFCDFDGNPVYITPRERIAVRSGEVLKTKITLDEKMIQESKKLVEAFKPCGPMTVQLIRQKETEEDYFIEINPRYGGGSPLSMKAGARSAEILLKLLAGEKVDYQPIDIRNNAVYSRFDQSVCIDKGDSDCLTKGVIFDLDDTLYSEKQYVISGYRAVAEFLNDADADMKLWDYFLDGKPAIDELLESKGIEDRKTECLKVYRSHMPKISLYEGIPELINKLRASGIKVGIITDGRVEGQKNKIMALGLDKLVDDIIITDELGGVQFRKPNDIAFRIMQCRWKIPFEQMVYVGDNPIKDFQAPKQLGMQSIYVKNKDGLYSNNAPDNSVTTISSINEMILLLKGIN